MTSIKIIAPVIANLEGKSVPLVEGQEIEVNEQDADNLVRGKYAEYIHAARPAVKVVNAPKPLNSKSIKGKK